MQRCTSGKGEENVAQISDEAQEPNAENLSPEELIEQYGSFVYGLAKIREDRRLMRLRWLRRVMEKYRVCL